MRDPAVSVVIPARNAERYLPAALESVLSQEGPQLQVVVVDDASTDGTAAVVRRFPGVRLVAGAGRGAAAARNLGIAHAGGALLAFLDADDLWAAGKVACQVDALRATPSASMAFGWVKQFVCPEAPEAVRASLRCAPDASPWRSSGTLLVARTLLEEVGTFDESLRAGEFIDWYSRARAAGARDVVVDRVVLYRRLHGGNMGYRRPDLKQELARVVASHLRRSRTRGDGR